MKSSRNNISLFIMVTLTICASNMHQTHAKPAEQMSFFRRFQSIEFRICKSSMFSILLSAVCHQHNPMFAKKKVETTEDSNFIEEKAANKFISHEVRRRSTTHDQNYMDECCGHNKHGCTFQEIFEYCNYVPVRRVVLYRNRKV